MGVCILAILTVWKLFMPEFPLLEYCSAGGEEVNHCPDKPLEIIQKIPDTRYLLLARSTI